MAAADGEVLMWEWIWPTRRASADARRHLAERQSIPQIIFVTHNLNHVQIFEEAAELLRGRGVAISFATIKDIPGVQRAIDALGYPTMDIGDLPHFAVARDVVCFGNDWGPKRMRRAMARLKRKRVTLVGVIEGARFSRPNRYARVDTVLYWGPSGSKLLRRPGRIVGSPIIERASRLHRHPPDRPHVVINYKSPDDAAFDWGRAAIVAAEAIDPAYVLSAHPASKGIPPDVRVSHEPFQKLLSRASLLITRSSTVIYEALAAGVSVLYFPLPDEERVEFGEPRGAFQIADNAADLLRLAQAYAADPRFDRSAASSFLDWHVSIDPRRPAAERMAEALADHLSPGPAIEESSVTQAARGNEAIRHLPAT
jgi:hypothetical protein